MSGDKNLMISNFFEDPTRLSKKHNTASPSKEQSGFGSPEAMSLDMRAIDEEEEDIHLRHGAITTIDSSDLKPKKQGSKLTVNNLKSKSLILYAEKIKL